MCERGQVIGAMKTLADAARKRKRVNVVLGHSVLDLGREHHVCRNPANAQYASLRLAGSICSPRGAPVMRAGVQAADQVPVRKQLASR
jgi:hypothetical protein